MTDRTAEPDSPDMAATAEAGGQADLRPLDVRLAEDATEIDAALALRYRVFFEERGADADALCRLARRDVDAFDAVCDHLVAIDRRSGAVVGTYRLLRRSVADRRNGFYSEQEFDLSPLRAQRGELLELGRSCIDRRYRTGGTVALLWQGLARYVFAHEVTLMFGCASLPGADPAALRGELAYLHAHHLAPRELRATPLAGRHVAMRPDPSAPIPPRVSLPPLLKGYLRLGGFVGDGAVVDRAFDTTDVCVVVETRRLDPRYRRHYDRQAGLVPA